MQRHRQVAAAPERRATEAWDAIGRLVAATLERSPSISRDEVITTMGSAAGVGAMLVAGGHLDTHPVVVVADPVYLSITTLSGTAATKLDEDLGPVPGGAIADEWTIYLPTPEPVGDAVRAAVAGLPHLSADEPPSESATKSARSSIASPLNLNALAQRGQERQ